MPLNILMPVGVLVNHKVHKDLHQLDHRTSIIMELIQQMAHQVHSHIKHQQVMIIFRPNRHLHPITVVDERAHIYTVQSFFSSFTSRSPYAAFRFVVLDYHYLYHLIDTNASACVLRVCVIYLQNNHCSSFFLKFSSSSLVSVACSLFSM